MKDRGGIASDSTRNGLSVATFCFPALAAPARTLKIPFRTPARNRPWIVLSNEARATGPGISMRTPEEAPCLQDRERLLGF